MLTKIEGQSRKKSPKLEERLVDSSIFFWLFQRHSFPTLHHTEEPQRWALIAIHDFDIYTTAVPEPADDISCI